MPSAKRSNRKRRRAKHKKQKASSSSLWVELPPEITANVLRRLGTVDILLYAQRVCATWWKVCKDPAMWRVIDMKNDLDYDTSKRRMFEKLCRIAVDRSQGQLLKITIENFGSTDLLIYLAKRSSQLRYLRFVWCELDSPLAAADMNFPLLEELHVYFSGIDIEVMGRSCPRLKSFTLNADGFQEYISNHDALAIAKTMPELRHLSLFGNVLDNEGLLAILDGCPHLESLDLRHCYNVNLEDDLGIRCEQQIMNLKDPEDSTHDYEFRDEIVEYYWPPDAELDVELALLFLMMVLSIVSVTMTLAIVSIKQLDVKVFVKGFLGP